MYALARSCQELQEKCLIFTTEKTNKKGFITKNLSGKNQESCQEIQENSRIIKNLAKKYGKIQEKGLNFHLYLVKVMPLSTTKIENW